MNLPASVIQPNERLALRQVVSPWTRLDREVRRAVAGRGMAVHRRAPHEDAAWVQLHHAAVLPGQRRSHRDGIAGDPAVSRKACRGGARESERRGRPTNADAGEFDDAMRFWSAKPPGSYLAAGGRLQGCPRGVSRPRWAPAFEQRRSRPGCVRHAAPFRSTCGTSLREARLERETRNSRGRTARLPRRSGHDRAGSLKSGVSRLPGTAPARRPPDRLGGRAAREPLPSGTASTRIRGAGRRTRGPRIRPGGVAPPPGGP